MARFFAKFHIANLASYLENLQPTCNLFATYLQPCDTYQNVSNRIKTQIAYMQVDIK